MGDKSASNIINAINKSKTMRLSQFINALLTESKSVISPLTTSRFLCVIITIVAILFLFAGVCIILLTDILFFANILVISDKTPGLSLTSNLK